MSFASRVERLRREYCRIDADELVTTVAADFMNGGAPSFPRAVDRRGALVRTFNRRGDETLAAFRQRARSEAQGLTNAASIVLGGIGTFGGATGVGGLPCGAVTLPDIPLHPSQREAVARAAPRLCAAGVGARARSFSRWRSTALLRDGTLAYSR